MLLLSLLLASCTSGADGPSATAPPATTTTSAPTTTTTATSTEAARAFRDCLLENDVEIEEIPIDATGRPRLDLVMITLDFSDPAVSEAVSLCSEHLATGALDLGNEDALRQAILAQLTEFSRCMVNLGVEGFPSPVPGYLGIGAPFPVAEIPYSDPDFTNAVEVCRASLLEALSGENGGS